ncbi:MAG: NADH-quinone oxidoreductase subunit J family protein [Chloroflexia bacterium]
MNIGGVSIPIPSLPEIVFLALSAIAILGAIVMITRQDAVHSALSLVVVLFQLAGMYVLLNAPFLAVLQVLVYAGAILVLFLFVIMLLQLRAGPNLDKEHPIQKVTAWPIGLLIGVELVVVIALAATLRAPALPAGTVQHNPTSQTQPAPASAAVAGRALNNPGGGWPPSEISFYNGEPRALGVELYTNFLWPFEIASFILLVAVIGAIVLARRDETESEFASSGITLGRSVAVGSPQAAEIEKVLGGQVPDVRVVPTVGGYAGRDPLPTPPQPDAGGRTPPSSAAQVGEDKEQP